MNQLANELRKQNGNCFLGWTSEGVIALMSRKKFCTKYTYAAYVAPSEEQKLIAGIKHDSPNEIVFNSSQWSMVIDEIKIKDRLPILYQYIEQTYQKKRLVGTYTIVNR